MSFRRVIETFENVAATSSRNAKIALLDALVRNPEDLAILHDVVMYTYYPFWTYRITAPDTNGMFPKFDDLNDEQSRILWNQFKTALDALRKRDCVLACGRSEIKSLIGIMPKTYQKYLAQIVNRDLKIGIQDFKRWVGQIIPKEPVMLCEKWDGEELSGDWIAEIKFDGYRAAVMVDAEGNCDAVSRGNKEFWNWEHIAEEIKALGLKNVVFDGEFYAGSWGLTSSICKSQQKPKVDATLLKYNIFDMLTMEEWNAQICTRTLRERKQRLNEVLGDLPSKYLVEVEGIPVSGVEECAEAGDRHYQQGHEGAVLKRLDSVYVWDRTTDWLKIKPEEDCDVTIVGVYEGKGRHVGRLGGFIVQGTVTYKKKQYEILSRCGGGLKDTERDQYWAMYKDGRKLENDIIEVTDGLVIEVRYQDVSTAITAESVRPGKPALRFPRFLRERRDKMAGRSWS